MLDEINAEIERLLKQPLSYQTIHALADLYTVRDHLGTETHDTDFLKSCSGKSVTGVLSVMDELMEAVRLTNTRLYECAQKRLAELP